MKNLFLFLLVVCSFSAKCQLIDKNVLNNKIVMLLDDNGSNKIKATCFILTDDKNYFLVTAKQEASKINLNTTKIFFSDTSIIAKGYDLKDFNPKDLYRNSENNFECYILELQSFDKKSAEIIKKSSLPLGMVFPSKQPINPKIDLLVMGYPLLDLDNFIPYSYKTDIKDSSLCFTIGKIDTPTVYNLIENHNMKGFSGSPIFVSVTGISASILDNTYLVGIVSEKDANENGTGTTIIIPSYEIVDLIKGR